VWRFQLRSELAP
jgi:hypothetical protein